MSEDKDLLAENAGDKNPDNEPFDKEESNKGKASGTDDFNTRDSYSHRSHSASHGDYSSHSHSGSRGDYYSHGHSSSRREHSSHSHSGSSDNYHRSSRAGRAAMATILPAVIQAAAVAVPLPEAVQAAAVAVPLPETVQEAAAAGAEEANVTGSCLSVG